LITAVSFSLPILLLFPPACFDFLLMNVVVAIEEAFEDLRLARRDVVKRVYSFLKASNWELSSLL